MQIELIGCTGAGKSTLANNIIQAHNQNEIKLVSSYDFVLQRFHLDWIRNHSLRMGALNTVSLLACLLTWPRNVGFFKLVVEVLRQLPDQVRLREKIKLIRLVSRNMGIYEIIQHAHLNQEIVLADEGTLHIAHYLFVHHSKFPDLDSIANFIHKVPMPDAVIYVKEPEPILLARTKVRGHKRIPGNSSELIERFIQHGQVVFEKLVAFPCVESRLLVVNDGLLDLNQQKHRDQEFMSFVKSIVENGIS